MNKELLENLLIEFDEMGYEPTILCDTEREIEIFRRRLKQVLDYLKAIDNSNPSEALECIESLRQECKSTYFDENGKQWWTTDKNKDYRCNTIKQAFLKAQKQEKVLEIIKVKDVDMYSLRRCETVEEYNIHFAIDEYQELTQEEFDTLKRYVKQ